MLNWHKSGMVLTPSKLGVEGKWFHCSFPFGIVNDDCCTMWLYFNMRDIHNESYVFRAKLKLPNFEILEFKDDPIFTPGRIGAFDDSGATIGSMIILDEVLYLFYTGWNLTKKVITNNSIGIAKWNMRTDVFDRVFDGPILTRSPLEPFSCASPLVQWDPSHQKFIMLYASMDKWITTHTVPKHFYDIKIASSLDCLMWNRHNKVAVTYESEGEYAFGRPSVIFCAGQYVMYFSVRGDSYRIEVAISNDLINWRRIGPISFEGPFSEWDVDMQTYPFVFQFNNIKYMFYNGNGYGETGIGLAVEVNT